MQSPSSYSSFDEVEIIATVVDMRSTYLDPLQIFGAVESGELDMRSCLVPVEHSPDLAGHGVDMVLAAEGVKQGGGLHNALRGMEEYGELAKQKRYFLPRFRGPPALIDSIAFKELFAAHTVHVPLMPLSEDSAIDPTMQWRVVGLVLAETEKGEYRLLDSLKGLLEKIGGMPETTVTLVRADITAQG